LKILLREGAASAVIETSVFLSQGNVIKQISESAFFLFFFFFLFFLTDCEAAVCSGGVYLVVMFQRVS